MSIYLLYKTTNNINSKYYVGKHKQETEKYDGYLGSGTAIINAVKKYGKHNFTREIIKLFDTESACFIAEEQYLQECWADRKCYNLCPGGKGGMGHRPWSKKQKASASQARKGKNNPMFGLFGANNPNFGNKCKDSTKQLIREKNQGVNNSQFTGYFVTPYGRYAAAHLAAEPIGIHPITLRKWCKNPDKIITKRSIHQAEYFTDSMLGKSYRSLGFYFEAI